MTVTSEVDNNEIILKKMGWNQKTEVLQSGNCLCVWGGGPQA